MLRRYGVLIPTPTMSVMRGCSIVQLVLFYKYSQHQLVENADSEATVDAGTAKISTRRSSVLVFLHDVSSYSILTTYNWLLLNTCHLNTAHNDVVYSDIARNETTETDDDSVTGWHLGWPERILDCELLRRSEVHQSYSVIFRRDAHFVSISFLPPHSPNCPCHPYPSSFF